MTPILTRPAHHRQERGIGGSPWTVGMLGAMLLFANGLFAVKYFDRLPWNTALLTAAFLAVYAGGLAAIWWAPRGRLASRVGAGAALGALVAASVAVLLVVDPHALRVDRWDMVFIFWDNVQQGIYPYTPLPGGNIPGPLPAFYLAALPFYAVGEVGYMVVAASLAFVALAWWYLGRSRASWLAAAALVLSLPMWWELAVRSTIVVNVVLVLAYVLWLERRRPSTIAGWVLAGLVGGLVLSTRSVVALPMAIYFLYAFLRQGRRVEMLVVGGCVALGFGLTMVPIYFWDPELFFVYNPLLLQSSLAYGPVAEVAIAGTLAAGVLSRSFSQVLLSSGIVLFAMILTVFVAILVTAGWAVALHESLADISYFSFSLPFIALALADRLDPETSGVASSDPGAVPEPEPLTAASPEHAEAH